MFHFINCNIQLFSKEAVCTFTLLPPEYENFFVKFPVFSILTKTGYMFIYLLLFFLPLLGHNFSHSDFNLNSPVYKWGWSYFQHLKTIYFSLRATSKLIPVVIYFYPIYCRSSLLLILVLCIYLLEVSQFLAFIVSLHF